MRHSNHVHWTGFGKCIYCGSPNGLTDSHIVPECLGSDLQLLGSVCGDCNSTIGRELEAKMCRDFSFYRFITQIKTKSGKTPVVEADLEVFGKIIKVHIGEGGLPRDLHPIVERHGDETKFLVSAESPEKLKQEMIKFEEIGIKFDPENIKEEEARLVFTIDKTKINSIEYLRLASKIAFERLCEYTPKRAFNPDYDVVKKFIRYGDMQEKVPAGLLFEETLVNEILPLPFPYHSIMLFGLDHTVAAIVCILGLFYYFVLLNTRNALSSKWADFIYIDPMTGKARQPILLHDYSLKRILSLVAKSNGDSDRLHKAQDFARAKFDDVIKQIRPQREPNQANKQSKTDS